MSAALAGKVALVTGAARGLGRAYAGRLAGLATKIAVAATSLTGDGSPPVFYV